MQRHLTSLVAAIIVVFLPLHAAWADNIEDSLELSLRNMVLPAANFGDFATLEKLADEHRTRKTRLPSGKWMLETYYSTFEFLLGQPLEAEANFEHWTEIWKKWRVAYPKSPTPIIAHARMLVQLAWSIRGNSYAHKVWKADMDRFEQELKRARDLLEQHRAIASQDPEWYAVMGDIYRGAGLPLADLVALVKEGVEKEPGYYRTYTRVMWHLTPKWGGSAQKLQNWARIAIDETQATDGRSIYARFYLALLGDAQFLRQSEVDMDLLKKAADDLIERYPSLGNYEALRDLACELSDAEWAKERWAANAKVAGPNFPQQPQGNCAWSVEVAVRRPWLLSPPEGGAPAPQRIGMEPAADAEVESAASKLLETTYFRDCLVELKSSLRVQLDGQLSADNVEASSAQRLRESWQAAVDSKFDVEHLVATMRSALASGMSKDELTQVLAYYDTPLGSKIREAERPQGLSDPNAQMARLESGMKVLRNDANLEGLLAQIVYGNGMKRASTDLQINTAFGTSLAIMAMVPMNTETPDGIFDSLESNRRSFEESMYPAVMAQAADMYRSASVAELDQHWGFLRTPVNVKLVSIQQRTMNEALLAQMYVVGMEAARLYKAQGI